MVLPVMIFVATMAAQVPPPYEEVYRAGGEISAPKLLSKVEPDYPESARKAGLTGVVVLALVVGSDGKPSDIHVVQSLDPGLDQQAVDALKKWRFHPGMWQGKPVAVESMVQMSFRLVKNQAAGEVLPIQVGDPIDGSLPAPVMVTPAAGEVLDVDPRLLQVSWEPAPGAASYIVEWDYAEGDRWHSEIASNARVGRRATGTKASIEFTGAQRGRCRVWPVNANGVRGTPTPWREFRFAR